MTAEIASELILRLSTFKNLYYDSDSQTLSVVIIYNTASYLIALNSFYRIRMQVRQQSINLNLSSNALTMSTRFALLSF